MRDGRVIVYILALVFWLSSWVPLPPNERTLSLVAASLAIFFITARLAKGRHAARTWISTGLSVVAILTLLGGVVTVAFVISAGTSSEGAIALFHTFGWAAYFLMLTQLLTYQSPGDFRSDIGVFVLLLLAAWSWISAGSMWLHRGVEQTTPVTCILVPEQSFAYTAEISAVWQMRLPDVESHTTGPTGTTKLNYHAILLVPGEPPHHYNWSKTRLRFEPLDSRLNPFLPKTCPSAPNDD